MTVLKFIQEKYNEMSMKIYWEKYSEVSETDTRRRKYNESIEEIIL